MRYADQPLNLLYQSFVTGWISAMSHYIRKQNTVLSAVSQFLAYHDKAEYEGVIMIFRQKNGHFDAFLGGTADDPECVDDWDNSVHFLESIIADMEANAAEMANTPHLQVVPTTIKSDMPDDTPLKLSEDLQTILTKAAQPGTCLNIDGEVVDKICNSHPRLNDKNRLVVISHPTTPTPLSAFNDPQKLAVLLPNGQVPDSLNAIPLTPWSTHPQTLAQWAQVDGQSTLSEPDFKPKKGKQLAAGVVVIEPDGRIWLVAPTNAFGGYKATFPKGRLESGMSPQASAIKEAYEEAGLQVEITGYLGDFERTTTITRYYTARRKGGLPTLMGWESQAVMLVPRHLLMKTLNHANDHKVVAMLTNVN